MGNLPPRRPPTCLAGRPSSRPSMSEPHRLAPSSDEARLTRSPMPGAFDRSDALRRLAGTQFDVVVVGGGITGAGCALDAASRGLRTALVERDDFASGTSSKSSKLIHGGLRYLQQKEVALS